VNPLDSKGTKEEHKLTPDAQQTPTETARTPQMSVPALLDHGHYEQACDQAIAMCDGNLRSTIKALIMANEYLEAELEELQAAISAGCIPETSRSRSSAA
jgi:hypothetical protein